MEEKELKKRLVEEVGVYFEQTIQLPPLAARIFVLLMLCPRTGHSFDELVEFSQSSKSSVSTNLNLLLSQGVVEYFTKPGERKRYFRLSKSNLRVKLKSDRDQVAEELKLLQKMDDFNRRYNREKYERHMAFGKLYREYLEMHHANLESTINKMNQLEKTI